MKIAGRNSDDEQLCVHYWSSFLTVLHRDWSPWSPCSVFQKWNNSPVALHVVGSHGSPNPHLVWPDVGKEDIFSWTLPPPKNFPICLSTCNKCFSKGSWYGNLYSLNPQGIIMRVFSDTLSRKRKQVKNNVTQPKSV